MKWPACLGLAFAFASQIAAQECTALQVWPASIQLDDHRDQPRITVVGTQSNGIQCDLTAAAVCTFTVPGVAELQRDPQHPQHLLAIADGETELVVTHGALTVRVPVRVRGAAIEPLPSFANDVLPALTYAGCNAGSCHGAAIGKNGFGLSLFAYDPVADHRVLTRELRGRRIDIAQPELSLFVQKGTGQVPHQGGKRLIPDGDAHRRILAWIRGGALSDLATAPVLQRIEVLPDQALLFAGSTLPLQVVAHYADGSDRDVTALVLWSSNDDSSVAVAADGSGIAKAVARGEAALLARFGGSAATAMVAVLADDRPWTWPEVAEHNFVDTLVHQKLRATRTAPAAVCSDEVFVRRAFLDVISALPTPDEVRAFLADQAADKRARLVDLLLQRPEFADAQAMAWAEVLGASAERMEQKGVTELTRWLRAAFAAGRPFDEVVRELLTSNGATFASPAANYWLAADQPHLLGEHTAQNFLGIRLQCAQCHNHPFENWTMDDYYGFAAFFAQVARKRGEDGAEWVVWDRRNGDVRNKRGEAIAPPRFLGGGLAEVQKGSDRRAVLAAWLTGPDNRWFARNLANRVWARLFGRGLVEPVDDVRIGNPPSHPALLQQLADLLVRERFDVRALYRVLCNSRTWQLARHPENPPAALFAGNQVRRLTAEQLLDAIGAVTEVPTRYPGLPAGTPASAIAGGRTNVRFLDIFGRPARESACTCDRRAEPTLGQTLHLINGDTIAEKIAQSGGRLQRHLAANTAPTAMLDELFLAAYARLPRDDERAHLLGTLGDGSDAKATAAAWQDVFWAVLNSREFLFQH